MTKARTLGNFVSTGNPLSDGSIAASEVTGLSTVATTGSYNDLSDKPTITTTATNIAGGSNGTIPYQSAAGTTQMLAVGSAGQLLQTNGAGAPTWVTPSAGAMVLISTVTGSAASTITVSGFSSTYDSYQIYVVGLNGGDSAQLYATLLIDGTNITTGYQSAVHNTGNVTTYQGTTGPDSSFRLNGDSLGPSTSKFNSTVNLFNVNSGGKKTFTSNGVGTYGGFQFANAWGSLEETGTITGMRFFSSTGTLTGTFRLYGIAK
jgi:hypothetical protein